MTNIEHFGFKNIKFEQSDYPDMGISVVNISYIPKHSKKDVPITCIIDNIKNINNDKAKWLLEEVEHSEPDYDRFSIELMYGLPYVYEMKHCKGGVICAGSI